MVYSVHHAIYLECLCTPVCLYDLQQRPPCTTVQKTQWQRFEGDDKSACGIPGDLVVVGDTCGVLTI